MAVAGREGRGRDGIVVVDQPLTAMVTSTEPDGGPVVVTVWAVLVVAALSSAPAYAWWHTTTVTVVWERDDWRIGGWVFTDGPTPAQNPKAVPAPFEQIATVGRWPAAYRAVPS